MYISEEMTGDSHSKKKGKRTAKQKSRNGKKGIVIADGTVLEQPDYDWSKVEAKIPKKHRLSASSSKGKQNKSEEHKSSKHKKRSSKAKPLPLPLRLQLPSPLLAMVSESEEFNNDKAEQLKLDPPPPPPPTEYLSALSLDDGDWNTGYSVPEILSPKSSERNTAMLDNLLKPPPRTLSTATTGDESIMSGSIMSESGWSDAVSSSESEGGY
jgi:hypothetical protein